MAKVGDKVVLFGGASRDGIAYADIHCLQLGAPHQHCPVPCQCAGAQASTELAAVGCVVKVTIGYEMCPWTWL